MAVVLETQSHLWSLVVTVGRGDTTDHGHAVVVVVHVEDLLLLSIQILRHAAHVLLSVHVGEAHGAGHENVVVLATAILLHAALAALVHVGEV